MVTVVTTLSLCPPPGQACGSEAPGSPNALVFWFLTPLALYVTFENTRSEIGWHRCQASLTAQGERITIRDILGPGIPAEQNAGAAEIFAPLFAYSLDPKRGLNGNGGDVWNDKDGWVVWNDSNAVTRLKERFGFPDGHWPKQDSSSSDKPHTPKVDLDEWAAAYRSLITNPKRNDPSWVAEMKLPPADSSPARVVLAGMAVTDRELAVVCEAARRPRSQFPVHWDEGFTTQIDHLALLKGASQSCLRRCAAHLEIGETDAAFADAESALNVAELLREEPLLISQLVRIAQGVIADKTVWQGLAPVATAVSGQIPVAMTPRTILVRMILPAMGRVCEKAVRAQTVNRMTAVTCALERYRLKNGAFPEKLDDLAPAFLPTPPLDPVNNQPFHYKRTSDGWFELYSIGLNGRDDGGVFKTEKGKAELDWVWPVPARPEKHLLF